MCVCVCVCCVFVCFAGHVVGLFGEKAKLTSIYAPLHRPIQCVCWLFVVCGVSVGCVRACDKWERVSVLECERVSVRACERVSV